MRKVSVLFFALPGVADGILQRNDFFAVQGLICPIHLLMRILSMTPLDAAGFPQSAVAGHDEADPAHVASLRVNYLSLSPQARSDSGMPLAQRSVSSVNCDLDTVNVDDGEAFDQDSVLYAQGVVSKIKKNQTLAFLWWQLPEELCCKQWSVRFRGCSNRVDFCQYSGFILDESDRLRVQFSGTIRPSRSGCMASVLSAQTARQINVNINELHRAPNDGNPRLMRLLKLAASLK